MKKNKGATVGETTTMEGFMSEYEPLVLTATKSSNGINITIELGDINLMEGLGIARYFNQVMENRLADKIKNK